ncbi:alpha/beta-hydrolase [Aspergillus eucalypticola CBS 122712]|uniref:Alpha/beta-hydrolase n=1 Tax=Aspergillus eucalypticola (strain CBS 122712 / IBT 29274) TaxID=1448314 RepID=A0A317V7M9_ASPEC|nr:alpha/beta-hydrolase [Aspergillus eucalypticola CBS 122712]PWY69429.1 alpha/beta-hydrolase [Aspergillus eucalypticola CBS 122712]
MTFHQIPSQSRVAEARNYDPWHLHEPSSQWIDFCHANGIPWCGVTSPDDEFPYHEDFDAQITNQWASSAQHEKRYEYKVKICNSTIPRSKEPNNPISIRVYYPIAFYGQRCTADPLPLYIHFRGGGFLCGDLDTEDAICAEMVSSLTPTCPIIVISIDYRSTVEEPFPAMYHDAWEAYEFIEERIRGYGGDPKRVILGGEDSGAALALWVAMFAKKTEVVPKTQRLNIVGLNLTTPWFPHMDVEKSAQTEFSRYQCWNAPFLPMAVHHMYRDMLEMEESNLSHFTVGECSDFSGLPRTCMLVAGQSLLRDQALRLAHCMEQAGVQLSIEIFSGMPHEFRRIYVLPQAEVANAMVEDNIRWILKMSGRLYIN